MLPTFMIIGAQKSASTFIQLCLAEHPEIFMPKGETPFFETPDYEQSEGLVALEKIFEGRQEPSLGIKRPNYLGKPEVPPRIQKHLPDAKLIAVLRNPIDRAISAYFHNIYYGFIPPLDVEFGMRKLLFDPSYSEENKRAPEILEFGFYYKYLSEYAHFIERNQLLIFLHEDVVKAPLESIQKTYEFLGVASDYTPKSLHSRPQRVLYNLKRLKLVSKRNRFMFRYDGNRTRLHGKDMSLIEKALAGGITFFDKKILVRLMSNEKPRISAHLRKMLYDVYADDIASLETMLDRDLSMWKP